MLLPQPDGAPPIEIDLRRSGRARRVSIRVSALDGRVTVTVPGGMPEREALDFARRKSAWIRRHLDRREAPVPVRIGATIPFEGREVGIAAGRVRKAALRDGRIEVPPEPARAGARVRAFLTLFARQRVSDRSRRDAALLGREVGGITLRDTRSRWGSCSSAGNLMFSWRLAMAPPDVLDYVVAHEVAHLEEMNHSPAYWDVVRRLFPGFEARRRWLRENGSSLHRFRFDD